MENDTRSKWEIAKKIIKIVLKLSYQLMIILCAIMIVIIFMQKITDNNKTILGYKIFRVITGSMEPEYDIGQVIISKEVPTEDIKVGDDIVYLGTYGDYKGKIIMHEVVGIDKDENNNLNFHAKGLHNLSIEDPQIKPNQIYGVVKFKSGILTKLYDLSTSIYSSFIIITILVANVFLSFRPSVKDKIKQLNEDYEDEYIYEDNEDDVEEEVYDEEEIEETEENEEPDEEE